jgi:hypothetical protein
LVGVENDFVAVEYQTNRQRKMQLPLLGLSMTQAQPLNPRDLPDLQYDEALAAKRVKGMVA